MPSDEQPRPQAVGPDPIESGRDAAGRLRTREAAVALARLPRRSRYVPRQFACDARFEPHNRRRLEWLQKRRSELHLAHGGVSHGVGALLSAAAWLHSAAEFAAELAAEKGDIESFRASGNLSAQARQNELGAWELGAREAIARQAASPAFDWLSAPTEPEADEAEEAAR